MIPSTQIQIVLHLVPEGNLQLIQSCQIDTFLIPLFSRVENGRFFDKNMRVKPYVDFSEYFRNVDAARKNKTLPQDIEFD